jgi:hypothetical protein
VTRLKLTPEPRKPSRRLPRVEAVPRPTAPPPKNSSETVTVCCKFPNGLQLHLCALQDGEEQDRFGDKRPIKIWRRILDPNKVIKLNGPAVSTMSHSNLKPAQIEELSDRLSAVKGGYALNPGIKKDLWDEWVRQQNKNGEPCDLLKNRIIFALKDYDSAVDKVKEHKDVLSGLEAIDPDNPGSKSRELRGIMRGNKEETQY